MSTPVGLRILHTSDWHLGHRLHDRERTWEHGRFIDWLLATLEEESVDALIIAGDIFDVAHPGRMHPPAPLRPRR